MGYLQQLPYKLFLAQRRLLTVTPVQPVLLLQVQAPRLPAHTWGLFWGENTSPWDEQRSGSDAGGAGFSWRPGMAVGTQVTAGAKAGTCQESAGGGNGAAQLGRFLI